MVPTFTTQPIGQLGIRLYPGSLAMLTPQTFSMASSPTITNGFGVVFPENIGKAHTASRPISTRFEPLQLLRDFRHRFTRVIPSGLACPTRTIW